jgi:manganese efflux pump family protein
MLTLLGIAVGLSMDAFAVSVSAGLCVTDLKTRHALRAAFFFGAFQALMPTIGWLLGNTLKDLIRDFDHWIAVLLLGFIGIKMAIEAAGKIRKKAAGTCDEEENAAHGILRIGSLTALAVATSIDALAVGLTISLIGLPVALSVAIIGGVTFVLCFLGAEGGKRIGSVFGNAFSEWSGLAGGIMLVAIGVKIAVAHLAQGI